MKCLGKSRFIDLPGQLRKNGPNPRNIPFSSPTASMSSSASEIILTCEGSLTSEVSIDHSTQIIPETIKFASKSAPIPFINNQSRFSDKLNCPSSQISNDEMSSLRPNTLEENALVYGEKPKRQIPACVEKIVSCLLNGWSLAHAPSSRSLCGMPLVQSDDTQTVVCPQCNTTKFVIKGKEQSYCDPHLKSNPKSSCITEAEINEMVAAIRVNGFSPTTRVCNSCGLELFKHVSGYSICLVCHPTVSLGGKHCVVQNKVPRCNINATTMFDEERQETAPREKAKSQEKRHDIPIASHRRALNLYCETKVKHCKRNGSTISLSSAFTKGAQIVATARCEVCNGPFMRCRFSKVVVCGSKGCPKGISQSNNIGVVFRYPGVNRNISRRTNEIRYRTGHEKSDGYMNKYESRDKTLPHSTFDHALWDTAHGGTISPARTHFQNKVGNCHNYSRMSNKHTLFPERATKRSLPIIFDDIKTIESKPFDED